MTAPRKVAVLMGSASDKDKMAPAGETLARYGIDALYATVQMPKGIPVATVAVDGAMNAALLAVQMLAIDDADLAAQLVKHRDEMAPKPS
jgi:phosphoribosylcarboxyaminoimidazole (NCAIR) mutase